MSLDEKKEKVHIFDKKRNVKILLGVFFSSVVLLLLLDLVYHRHAYFPWEERFGFYCIFGFVACVILVLVARFILRPLVIRDEDYYDK
ncbi:MAG: hypothetical protein ACOC0U_00235 [Desulfovibrionales bacterium]